MSVSDWIGTLGVTLLLIAFALNVTKKLSVTDFTYLILNILGAGLACVCSYMIGFWPFVILEFVWMSASVVALVKVKFSK